MKHIWLVLKNDSEARRLFAGMIVSGTLAIGIPAVLVLNYFFQCFWEFP